VALDEYPLISYIFIYIFHNIFTATLKSPTKQNRFVFLILKKEKGGQTDANPS
jgi:hypothetical protein